MLDLFSTEGRSVRQASRWLARLQGPATPEDRAAFARWYRSRPANARAFDRVAGSFDTSGLLARTQMGRERSLPRVERVRAVPGRYALAAAAAVAVIAAGAVLTGISDGDGLLSSAEAKPLVLETAVGEVRSVPLQDGTKVTLDTDSALVVHLRQDERHLTLRRGRARLAVAHDPRALTVRAGPALVIARSGVLDVSLSDGYARVAMLTGAAEVRGAGEGAAEPPAQTLRAGEALTVTTDGTLPTPQRASEARWPAGMLDFENRPLREVIAEANRYGSDQLVLGDGGLGGLKVTGAYRSGDLAGLAHSLAAAFGLRLERGAEGEFVLMPRVSGHPQPQAGVRR